jgi:hypothetical protein
MHSLHKLQLALLSYFVIIFVFVHFVNTLFDWRKHMLSLYVHGPYGILLVIAIACLGFVQLLVAYEHRDQLASWFFGIAGVGSLVVAAVPMDLYAFWSTQAIIHLSGAGLHFIALPIALLIFQHKKSKLHVYTKIVGAVMLAISVLLVLSVIFKLYLGVLQKITILLSVTWFAVSALVPGGDLYK